MIHADRTQPLPAFVDFVRRNDPQDWSSDFVLADRDLYLQCRTELLRTQDFVSAYTELPLSIGGNIHIDHFKKRGIRAFANQKFCWSNFIVDKRDETDYGAGYKDKMVNSEADYDNLINPAEPNPERYFSYLVNGKMIPAKGLSEEDKAKAEYTITIFNLNHPSLMSCRQTKIMSVLSYRQAALDDAEIMQYMEAEGFQTVISYALGLAI